MKVWLIPSIYQAEDDMPLLICSLRQLEAIYKEQPELEVWIKGEFPYVKHTGVKLSNFKFIKMAETAVKEESEKGKAK